MFKTVIDLTHPLDSDVPTWTGSCGFYLNMCLDYDQGLRVQEMQMSAGIGTHMDAPSHFIPGGKDIHELSVYSFFQPLFVITVQADEDYLVSVKDILQFEKSNGRISKDSIVIISTGWEKHWKSKKYRNEKNGKMHFPSISLDAAKLLCDREVSGIGIDTLSPDCQDLSFPVHKLVLGQGRFIVENLAHVQKVPPKGGFCAMLPINVVHATEAPIRAVVYF